MVANYPGAQSGFFAKPYVNFIYIPSGLLLVGCAITKPEWLPYAAAIALTLGSWQYYDMQPRPVLKPNQFQEFELQEKTIVSHNVAIYRFRLPSSKSVLGLPIGQHVSAAVRFPGQERQTQRSYTPITSDEENRGYFDLLVKSYPSGNLSKHMASLQIGQTLRFQGPKGAMVYTPNMCRRIGMIAGGTGITPMLQIIKAIVRGRPRNGGQDITEVNLIFANVNKDDILLREDLDTLAAEDDRFNVHYVLNNPPEKWTGDVGFVTQDMIKAHLPPPASDIKILVCGPPPMVDAMRVATEAAGYEKPLKRFSKLPDQVFYF